ncbi:MAG: STAS domain-containing protein [Spirochaetes bacterium]|nr:STAS domain-containing protein [Spirochaetota bacterium]
MSKPMEKITEEYKGHYFGYKITNKKFYLELVNKNQEIDLNNVAELFQIAETGVKKGYKTLHFDFKDLKFIDSAGIGKLIKLSNVVKVVLLNVNDKIKEIIKITKVASFFTIK